MEIEINHLENISIASSPNQKSFKSPEQTQHHGNDPNPSRKKSQTLPKASPPLQKHLNPSRKNFNLPEKLPLPKNSITITETISNTLTKNSTLPEKSQPLVKNSQSLLKKSQPPTPLKKFQPSLKMS